MNTFGKLPPIEENQQTERECVPVNAVVSGECYKMLQAVEEYCREMRNCLNGNERIRLKHPLNKIKSYIQKIELDVEYLLSH